MRRVAAICLCSLFACGDDAGERLPVSQDASAVSDAQDAGLGSGDAGSASASGLDPMLHGCDLSGLWSARMNAESLALGMPQYANAWYYFEFAQRAGQLEVVRHIDCGIEVRGTVTVTFTPETTKALSEHNRQIGRKATVTLLTDGTCAVEFERFWSVRGVNEEKYVPKPRNSALSIEQVRETNPLPSESQPELSEDWDADGHPAIAWNVTGIISGRRDAAQRDYTRFFTAPGYAIAASTDFRDDLIIRAETSAEEIVYGATTIGLDQVGKINAAAEHTLTLRYHGRSRDDPRALPLVQPDDMSVCLGVREQLPARRGLR